MSDLDELIAAFPRLFRGERPIVHSYLSPGWREIVFKLCSEIDVLLPDEAAKKFAVLQVKEKFGTLRFYWRLGKHEDIAIDVMNPDGHSRFVLEKTGPSSIEQRELFQRIRELVKDAEKKSAETCEDCGAPGKLRKGGWLQTLCDEHAKDRTR